MAWTETARLTVFVCGLPAWLWNLALAASAIVFVAGAAAMVLYIRHHTNRPLRRKPPCQPDLLR